MPVISVGGIATINTRHFAAFKILDTGWGEKGKVAIGGLLSGVTPPDTFQFITLVDGLDEEDARKAMNALADAQMLEPMETLTTAKAVLASAQLLDEAMENRK